MTGYFSRHLDPLLPLLGAVLLLCAGALVFPKFLSLAYILQQLQIASYLGIIATGAMIVILLGQIDLSIPWTLTGAAIISTTLAASGVGVLEWIAVPAALLFGGLIGTINGFGVAVFGFPQWYGRLR